MSAVQTYLWKLCWRMVPSQETHQQSLVNGKQEFEHLLNTKVIDSNHIVHNTDTTCHTPFQTFNHVITYSELMQTVTQSKSNKAIGVDELPGEVLRHDITCEFLLKFFNLCFQSGIIPDSWK